MDACTDLLLFVITMLTFKSSSSGFVLIRFLTNDPHFVTDCCEMPSSGSSSKKQQFQVIDLNEAFQRNPGEDREQLKIDELHVRQIIKVTLKINGKTIYQADDVNHVIALHPGEDEGLSYKNEWADLDMKSNKTFQQYLSDFNECTAPLAE